MNRILVLLTLVAFGCCNPVEPHRPVIAETVRYDEVDETTGYLAYTDNVYLTARNAVAAENAYTTVTAVGQLYDGLNPTRVSRALIRIETSSIPDNAIITAATLKLVVLATENLADNFYMHLVAPNDTINAETYDVGKYSRFDGWAESGAYTVTDWADSLTTAGANPGDTLSFALYTAGIEGINKYGITQFFILSGQDIGAIEPSDDEEMIFSDNSIFFDVTYTLPPTQRIILKEKASLTPYRDESNAAVLKEP